jgi:hypothetical protein
VDWAQQNGVKLPERATQQTVQPVFKWDEGRAGNILHVGAAAARAARARCPTASG